MNEPVVVGVDRTQQSLAAVDLAAAEAARRGRPLSVVHADPWLASAGTGQGGSQRDTERILAPALARARTAAPDVEVSGRAVRGFPQQALAELSRSAVLIVVGDRGLGTFARMLADEVACGVAAHASCPVLIARGTATASGGVAVGVSGDAPEQATIGFAFQEASLRGCALDAVHAWSGPVSRAPGDMLPLVFDPALLEAEEELVLTEALAGWSEQYPDVPVRRRLRRARVERALREAGTTAQLVVVGAEACRAFDGLRPDSVGRALSHHAACPVAIVPHTRPVRPERVPAAGWRPR